MICNTGCRDYNESFMTVPEIGILFGKSATCQMQPKDSLDLSSLGTGGNVTTSTKQAHNDDMGPAKRARARLAKLFGDDFNSRTVETPAPLKAAEG